MINYDINIGDFVFVNGFESVPTFKNTRKELFVVKSKEKDVCFLESLFYDKNDDYYTIKQIKKDKHIIDKLIKMLDCEFKINDIVVYKNPNNDYRQGRFRVKYYHDVNFIQISGNDGIIKTVNINLLCHERDFKLKKIINIINNG